MKDHIEGSQLTEFNAFRENKDQVRDLETGFKIHTNVYNFATIIFMIIVISFYKPISLLACLNTCFVILIIAPCRHRNV